MICTEEILKTMDGVIRLLSSSSSWDGRTVLLLVLASRSLDPCLTDNPSAWDIPLLPRCFLWFPHVPRVHRQLNRPLVCPQWHQIPNSQCYSPFTPWYLQSYHLACGPPVPVPGVPPCSPQVQVLRGLINRGWRSMRTGVHHLGRFPIWTAVITVVFV